MTQEVNTEPKERRKRRDSKEMIRDLQAKIQHLKDRDALKAAGETPAIKALIRALMATKRARKVADSEHDDQASAALEAASAGILAELERRNIKMPESQ